MKQFLIALGLGAMMCAAPAVAQTTMRFNVPFAFVAGDHVMPAGAYRVTLDNSFGLARFEGLSDLSVQLVRLVPGGIERKTGSNYTGSLRFAKYGEKYFLDGVWKAGSIAGNATIPSKRMLESAKAGQPADTVSVSVN